MNTEPYLQRTKVDLSGLMKVLGESLYSTPNVAIRELIQNAHDSCQRRRLEANQDFEPRILVTADAALGVLHIDDNGAGLTDQEIEKYLATVGNGYTRTLRDQGASGLIGYFGLGFLSAFVVSERTEVYTASYQEPEKAWLFSSRTGETYSVRPADPRPVGTRVTLHLSARFRELSSARTVRALLERYCCLLEFPIHCGDAPAVNATLPPWRSDSDMSSVRKRKLALEFAQRFEHHFEPLCTIVMHPNPENSSTARGLMWVQDGATYGTSDNRNVAVFVRGMLVGEDERELLPRWAGFVGAVLESDELSPTASRESLLKNAFYENSATDLSEALIAGLSDIARHEPASWRRILTRHNEALLGAGLCDARLFRLLAKDVTLPTSQGDLTLPVIVERSKGKLYVTQAETGGFEELLFRALRVPVVLGTRYAALPFCEKYAALESGTVVILGTGLGERALFQQAVLAESDRLRLLDWFGAPDTEVVLSRFQPSFLPLVLVHDREIELKRRLESDEADRRLSSAVLGMARLFTSEIADAPIMRLHVNLDCEIITALLAAAEDSRERAVKLLKSLVCLLSDTGERDADRVERALRDYCAAIGEMLEFTTAKLADSR